MTLIFWIKSNTIGQSTGLGINLRLREREKSRTSNTLTQIKVE